MGTFLVLRFGIALGMLAAFRRGSGVDRVVVMLGVFGISSPPFVTGIFLLYIFGVVLGWFPTFGPGRGFLDRCLAPRPSGLALALSVMAIVVKITRASVDRGTGQGLCRLRPRPRPEHDAHRRSPMFCGMR